MLIEQGQVLSFFEDLPKDHPAFKVCQLLSVKGFFSNYNARTDDPLTVGDATRIIAASFPHQDFIGFADRSSNSFVGEVEWKTICASLAKNSPIPEATLAKERATPEDAVTRRDAFAILGQAQSAES
jgi:hypothetical protein